ncbi:transferase hexapeptide domain protein [Aspergillus undulatus]|uniref:transferase hexapeptide domain protein n=1 Tax=Aspergillus undulatus TaxID=1810928 RepID=UPI003CCD50C2
MDQRQPSSSSQHLRPPPHHRPSSQTPQSQPFTPRPPPAQISAHPSATVSDSANFCGPYSISIGKGTIIHPRTRICATEGAIKIGEGCIIAEKSVIGTPPNLQPGSGSTPPQIRTGIGTGGEEQGITISNNVTIGAQVTIASGVRLHSGVVVDNQVTIGRGADVGAHSKICAGTEILDKARVKEWVVVWGGGRGSGVRTRARVQDKVVSSFAADGDLKGVMEGRVIEDARLVAVRREREMLSRLIVGVKRK